MVQERRQEELETLRGKGGELECAMLGLTVLLAVGVTLLGLTVQPAVGVTLLGLTVQLAVGVTVLGLTVQPAVGTTLPGLSSVQLAVGITKKPGG